MQTPNENPSEQPEAPIDFGRKLEELEARMTEQWGSRLEAVVEENAELRAQVELTREELQQQRDLGVFEEVEPILLYDPFDVQNGLAIKQLPVYDRHGEHNGHFEDAIVPPDAEFPEGQVLCWISPRVRLDKGWMGWIPFEYGDAYTGETGELLKAYLPDPPIRGSGVADSDLDNCVRRKGLVLCRLDKRINDSRALKSAQRDAVQRGRARQRQAIPVAPNISLVGEGMQNQPEPPEGFKVGEKLAMGKGTLMQGALLPRARAEQDQ